MDRGIDLEVLAEQFEHRSPQEILAWAVSKYDRALAMSTGFGPSGIVLMHMSREMGLDLPVFYIDTGLLFPEVHQLRVLLEQTLGTRFERVVPTLSLEEQSRQFGEKLWERDPDTCCWLRKVLPLQSYLRDKQAWVTAIRADQTSYRSKAKIVEWDERNQVVKINPLLRWSGEQVWEYIRHHRLPYNPLHDRGYPSLGCIPCTSPVCEGEDLRAGRWRGKAKVECGIHFQKMQP